STAVTARSDRKQGLGGQMKEFNDKVAVITGAGSGFGREFARVGAALGMKLVLADIQEDALLATAGELRASGAEVLARKVDVSDGAQVDALAAATMETFGSVHLLFNNAGIGAAGLVWENTVQDWQWALGVNLWGVIHGVRAFTPLMLAAAKASADFQGHIVNTSSMAGLLNQPNMGAYNVSKHAVVSLSETLFHDLSLVTDQVHCSVLCPYFVPTGIHQSSRNRPADLRNDAPATQSQLIAQAMVDKAVTSGRLTAEHIAQLTFEAIRGDAFYIVSHPNALEGIRQGAEDLVALRNPSDPFANHPEQRARLEAALRG
ncbi:MAG: SDR family oxidoreductase, partial [Pseudoxanthomonas sp.]